MRGKHIIHIVLCGTVAGFAWYLLSVFFLSFSGQDLLAAVGRTAPHPPRGGFLFFAVDLLMGIWAIWLYSAIIARFGARMRTAAIAGAAWWAIKSLQSAKWAGLGFVPQEVVLLPLVTSLVAAIAALVLGAWLYDSVQMPIRMAANRPPQGSR